jgi:dipeptidyl-peptidase 4
MDQREVSELYLVDVLADPRPRLVSYRYAMPGEENVAQVELLRWSRGDRTLTPVDVSQWKDQRLFNIHWTTGSDRIRLTRRDRLQRNLELIEVALPSNDIRILITERVENAYLESQPPRYVKAGGDFLWWSERTGWGHYYLYDHEGNLKRPITSGEWRADSFLAMDSVRAVAWITGFGREPGENVYYRHTYRANLGSGALQLVDAGEAEHQPNLSPSRRWLLDNYSRIDMPTEAVVRDANTGAVVLELEKFDTRPLEALGWQPPEQFRVKAADGVTDIYGNMWKPFDFDSTKSLPDHRARVSRPADRAGDVRRSGRRPCSSGSRSWASLSSRSATAGGVRGVRTRITATATTTSATTVWPTRRPGSSSSRRGTRGSTSTGWASTATRVAAS